MALKFYTSVVKGLKLKVRKFWGLIPAITEKYRQKTSKGGDVLDLIRVNILQ